MKRIGIKIHAVLDGVLHNGLQGQRRLAEAREGDLISVLTEYKAEIEKETARMRTSKNGFVRQCCQQTIDQMKAEKMAIEDEMVG